MTERAAKEDLPALVMRLGLAVIFVFDGWMKIEQGGNGTQWSDELQEWFQAGIAWGQLVLGGMLIIGLMTRWVSLLLFALMAGAIFVISGQRPIGEKVIPAADLEADFVTVFINYEYLANFALAVICLSLMLIGSGRYSMDRLFFGKKNTTDSH